MQFWYKKELLEAALRFMHELQADGFAVECCFTPGNQDGWIVFCEDNDGKS